MIWPFSKRISQADQFLALMPELVELVSEKWLFFTNAVPFNDEVPLRDRIAVFSVPAMEGMRQSFRELKRSPDSALFLVVAFGVVESGTHTREDVEDALGIQLPEADK